MRKQRLLRGLLWGLLWALLTGGCGRAGQTGSVPVNAGTAAPAEEDTDVTDVSGESTAGEAQEAEDAEASVPDLHEYDFTLAFAGDINLADDWGTMGYYRAQGEDIRACIDPQLIARMQAADLMCLNLECCLSDEGEPMAGKAYTFRGDPAHVQILEELGVDLVNLANNHVFDYGEDAFLDMLSILDGEGLPYVGAGADAGEAKEPWYGTFDGRTVAVVSATRAEKYILTPEAGADTPGVFRCYDTEALLETVEEADRNADFVIAYIHWGTEYSEELEDVQVEGARALAEAGADVVLGAHPHCLQGAEFVDGTPVFYSLGNYWFNEKTLATVLLELHFYGNDEEQHLEITPVPARQEGYVTRLLTEPEEVEAWEAHLEAMEPSGVSIDEYGIAREVE